MQAEEAGLKSLGSTVDMLGPYQANGAFVKRAWAKRKRAGPSATSRPISRRCACDAPGQPGRERRMLMEKLKLSRGVAERTYAC